MPTVIDELIVTLGLDPTKFAKGKKEAADALIQMREGARKTGDEVERSGERMSQSLSMVTGRMLRLAGLFVGGYGIKEWLGYIVGATASLGRLAPVVEMSAQELYAWQKAGGKVGATAQDIAGSIGGLVQEFQRFTLTGESSVVPYFRALGVNIANAAGQMRPMTEILLDVSRKFQTMSAPRAMALGTGMGLTPGMIQLLLKGPEAVSKYLEEMRKLAPTAKEIEAAAKAQAEWNTEMAKTEAAARTLTMALMPLGQWIMETLGKNDSWVSIFKILRDDMYDFGRAMDSWLTENFDKLDALTGGRLSKAGVHLFGAEPFDQRFGSWSKRGTAPYGMTDASPAEAAAFRRSRGYSDQQSSAPSPGTSAAGGAPGFAGAPPAAVLAKAKEVAIQSGPAGVQAFMASQGYPMSGNWCGEFAAAVVRSTGGVPPKGASIASNWRNYGQAVDTPQPGDVAIRKGVPTGATGSHVTFVDRYDPVTGTFKGFGGNQGSWSSNFPASQFDFRRSLPPDASRQPVGSVPAVPMGAAASAAGNVDNSRSSSVRSETNVGTIVVHTNATDAAGIARDIKPALERNSFATQSNNGPN